MKYLLIAVVAILVAVVAFMTVKKVSPVGWGLWGTTNTSSGVALGGYDAVSYFEAKEPLQEQSDYRYRWRDAGWHFSPMKKSATVGWRRLARVRLSALVRIGRNANQGDRRSASSRHRCDSFKDYEASNLVRVKPHCDADPGKQKKCVNPAVSAPPTPTAADQSATAVANSPKCPPVSADSNSRPPGS